MPKIRERPPQVMLLPPSTAPGLTPEPPAGLSDRLYEAWRDFWEQDEAGRLTPIERLDVYRMFRYMQELEHMTPANAPTHAWRTWADVCRLEAAICRLEARLARVMGS